jgi:hypothetical protein
MTICISNVLESKKSDNKSLRKKITYRGLNVGNLQVAAVPFPHWPKQLGFENR